MKKIKAKERHTSAKILGEQIYVFNVNIFWLQELKQQKHWVKLSYLLLWILNQGKLQLISSKQLDFCSEVKALHCTMMMMIMIMMMMMMTLLLLDQSALLYLTEVKSDEIQHDDSESGLFKKTKLWIRFSSLSVPVMNWTGVPLLSQQLRGSGWGCVFPLTKYMVPPMWRHCVGIYVIT